MCAYLSMCLWGCVCTVSLAGSSSVTGGTEASLYLAFAELKVVRVSEESPAGVPDPLLLSRPHLSHINRVPGCPRGGPPHFSTPIQITRLILLDTVTHIAFTSFSDIRVFYFLWPVEDPTRGQPGHVFPFSQVRTRDWTPPPQATLHLDQELQETQDTGTGHWFFSLHNLNHTQMKPNHLPVSSNKHTLMIQFSLVKQSNKWLLRVRVFGESKP